MVYRKNTIFNRSGVLTRTLSSCAIFTLRIMKGWCNDMILFTVLLILLLVFSVCAIFTIGTCGIVFVLMFGDVIICIGLIVIIIRYIIKRRK